MRAARVVALGFVSFHLVAACAGAPAVTAPTTSDSPAATPSSPSELRPPPEMAAAPSIDADAGQATSTADAAVVAVSTPDASSSAPPIAQAAPIPCKTTDDCWISGESTAAKPIRRPAKLRGKKFRPCVDGEAMPICRAGVCATLGFGC